MPANQIEDSQPRDEGKAFQFVIPGRWGKAQTFRKLVTPEPTLLLADLLDKAGEPVTLPDQTYELTGIYVQNFTTVSVWWGDAEVEPGFGSPIIAGAAARDADNSNFTDQPGFILFTGVDPKEIYVVQAASASIDVELVVQLFGRFVKASTGS